MPYPHRFGLSPWASFSEPGSRTRASSYPSRPSFISTPVPPMFVPEPGMNRMVVTPAASGRSRPELFGTTAGVTRSSELSWNTMSLMSPREPPTWLCRSMKPGTTQRSP